MTKHRPNMVERGGQAGALNHLHAKFRDTESAERFDRAFGELCQSMKRWDDILFGEDAVRRKENPHYVLGLEKRISELQTERDKARELLNGAMRDNAKLYKEKINHVLTLEKIRKCLD